VAAYVARLAKGMAFQNLRDRFARWRNDKLADPKMQRRIFSFPIFGGIARRKARTVFDLCVGFVHTQVVTACVELGVLDILAYGPLDAEALAERTGLRPEAMRRLLDAAVAICLITRAPNGVYGLDELGASLRGAPGVIEMIRHNQVFYRDLSDPVALLRGDTDQTELSQYWGYADGGPQVSALPSDGTDPYTALMAATQPVIAEDVVDAYAFKTHRAMLDVGGGDGAFVAHVAAHVPRISVAVFDIPSVSQRACERFAAQKIADRARFYGGDFHRDPLPEGYDLISFVRILLDHDDAAVARLLAAARAAIAPGGTILIAETMSGTPGAETIADAYFNFYLMAMGRGQPRSGARIAQLLRDAGFESPRQMRTRRALTTQLMVARAPA